MIALYDDSGKRLKITHRGLDLNDPSDDPLETYEVNGVITVPQYDSSVDADPSRDGVQVTPAKRAFYVVRLEGVLRSKSYARHFDMRQALARAFDPALASLDLPDTDGVSALDFSVPTEDTTNFATGLVPSRYYGRSRAVPIPIDSVYQGLAAMFTIEFLVTDPRRYLQNEDTLSGAGTTTYVGDYPTWPTLTITMSGAGSSTYKVTSDPVAPALPTRSLTLDLSSLVSGDEVVVDMGRRKITVNGGEDMSLFVGGEFFPLHPGGDAISYTNNTNATSVLTYRQAFIV